MDALSQHNRNIVPLDHLLFDSVPPELHQHIRNSSLEQVFDMHRKSSSRSVKTMAFIFDALFLRLHSFGADVSGEAMVKFNDEKAIKWMSARVVRLAGLLESLNPSEDASKGKTSSSHFVDPDAESGAMEADNDDVPSMLSLQDAVHLVSEFVSPELTDSVKSMLHVAERKTCEPQGQYANEKQQVESRRNEEQSEVNGNKGGADQKPLTSQQKKLAKTNLKGMKSMKSFFVKK